MRTWSKSFKIISLTINDLNFDRKSQIYWFFKFILIFKQYLIRLWKQKIVVFTEHVEKTKWKLRKYILKQIDKKKKKLKDDDDEFIHFSYKDSLNDLNNINDLNSKYELKRFYKMKKNFSSTNAKRIRYKYDKKKLKK